METTRIVDWLVTAIEDSDNAEDTAILIAALRIMERELEREYREKDDNDSVVVGAAD